MILLKAHPVTQAASRAATPADLNDGDVRRNPGEPSREQAEANAYNKPRVAWRGLTIAVENPAGSVRRGKGWEVRMKFDYGEIMRTEGVDGDPVDVILGPNMDAPTVYVVHQRRYGDWEKYDEDKCCIGFDSEDEARAAFLSNYTDPRFLGPVTAMPADEFVAKVKATRKEPAMIKSDFGHLVLFLKARTRGDTSTGDMFGTHVETRTRKDGVVQKYHVGSAAPSTAVAPRQRLFIQRGSQRHEIGSLAEASKKWNRFRDATGAGVSELGNGATIVDQHGAEVARISYNGRVWPPGEWHGGMKPLIEAGETEKDAALDAAIDHLKEDAGQRELPAAEKKEDAALVAKLEEARGDDPEADLRAMWTEQGVSKERQDELIRQIADKAKPGAQVGPFTVGANDGPDPNEVLPAGHSRKFYVTMRRDGEARTGWLAGPFDRHEDALAHVDRAREAAYEVDPRSHFDAFGTASYVAEDGKHHPGVLNERLGVGKKAQVTETPAFKRWFGDSKVVDENGKPLVMVHASPRSDIVTFRPGEDGGIWFAPASDTSDADIVASYDNGRGFIENPDRDNFPDVAVGSTFYPAYIRIENPAPVDHPAAESGYPDVAALKKDGYDGVIYDDGTVVAFSPEQIKSAIGNRGTFDPREPNMTKSLILVRRPVKQS